MSLGFLRRRHQIFVFGPFYAHSAGKDRQKPQTWASLSAASLVVAAGATLFAQETQDLKGLRFRFPGAVYSMSNAPDRNRVLIFDRLADGRLVRAGAVSTGGTGTGAG